jgi:hypothetical protein
MWLLILEIADKFGVVVPSIAKYTHPGPAAWR